MSKNDDWIREVLIEFQGKLIAYVSRILGDQSRAQEVVQESFLRLISKGEPRPKIPGWLFFVCRNLAIDILRKEKKNTVFEEGTLLDLNHVSAPDQIETKEETSKLRDVLEKLPAKYKEVVVLKFQSDLSYKQISGITGLTASNVGYILHQAIKLMKDEMAEGEV